MNSQMFSGAHDFSIGNLQVTNTGGDYYSEQSHSSPGVSAPPRPMSAQSHWPPDRPPHRGRARSPSQQRPPRPPAFRPPPPPPQDDPSWGYQAPPVLNNPRHSYHGYHHYDSGDFEHRSRSYQGGYSDYDQHPQPHWDTSYPNGSYSQHHERHDPHLDQPHQSTGDLRDADYVQRGMQEVSEGAHRPHGQAVTAINIGSIETVSGATKSKKKRTQKPNPASDAQSSGNDGTTSRSSGSGNAVPEITAAMQNVSLMNAASPSKVEPDSPPPIIIVRQEPVSDSDDDSDMYWYVEQPASQVQSEPDRIAEDNARFDIPGLRTDAGFPDILKPTEGYETLSAAVEEPPTATTQPAAHQPSSKDKSPSGASVSKPSRSYKKPKRQETGPTPGQLDAGFSRQKTVSGRHTDANDSPLASGSGESSSKSKKKSKDRQSAASNTSTAVSAEMSSKPKKKKPSSSTSAVPYSGGGVVGIPGTEPPGPSGMTAREEKKGGLFKQMAGKFTKAKHPQTQNPNWSGLE